MLLYCPKCQNLIDKTSDEKKDGETVIKNCYRCGAVISYYIKYKAVSSIVRKSFAQKR